MTKSELVDVVKGEMSRKEAEECVEKVFAAVKAALKKNGKFAFPGFGTFAVKSRAARKGKNPRTGAVIDIAASKAVVFRAASTLKAEIQ
jgi:DNA-binding protein HU-beta